MKFRQLLERKTIPPEKLPVAKSVVDGLKIIKDIPNQSSIPASLDNYEILRGIREVPIDQFDYKLRDLFYSKSDMDRTRELANKIKESRAIKPLIVVYDKKGYYVLEGGHRLGALGIIGAKKFPAMVVVDLD